MVKYKIVMFMMLTFHCHDVIWWQKQILIFFAFVNYKQWKIEYQEPFSQHNSSA